MRSDSNKIFKYLIVCSSNSQKSQIRIRELSVLNYRCKLRVTQSLQQYICSLNVLISLVDVPLTFKILKMVQNPFSFSGSTQFLHLCPMTYLLHLSSIKNNDNRQPCLLAEASCVATYIVKSLQINSWDLKEKQYSHIHAELL